jgi:hypothetical protein
MKALFLLLLAFLAFPAFGQETTYVYSGATLTTTKHSGRYYPPPTQITGSVTLSAPLVDNQVNQLVVPVDYEFNGNSMLASSWLNQEGPPRPQAFFSFSTKGGQIIAWTVSLYGIGGPVSPPTVQVTSSATGDAYHYYQFLHGCRIPAFCITNYEATSTSPGTWTLDGTVVSAVPPDPLQLQLEHVTSEMNFYRNGTVNWETQALAWQARAYYWCNVAKGSC